MTGLMIRRLLAFVKEPPLFKNRVEPFFVMLALFTTEIATDLYLPALPFLNGYFSTTEEIVGWTLSCYFFAPVLSCLLFGPFSDRFGRSRILTLGMLIYASGAFLCAVSQSIEELIIFRFVQGFGSGAPWVVGIALMRDLYREEDCSRVLSFIYGVIALAPAIGASLGGYLVARASWRWGFALVAVLAFLCVFCLRALVREPEKLKDPKSFKISSDLKVYGNLLRNWGYLAYALTSSLISAGYWSCGAVAPYLFIDEAGYTPEFYGNVQAGLLLVFIVGAYMNYLFIKRWGIDRTLLTGISLCALSSILLFLVQKNFSSHLMFLILTLSLYSIGTGMVYSNTASRAFRYTPRHKGAAASLMSTLESILPAASISLTLYFYDQTFRPVAWISLGSALLSLFLVIAVVKRTSFLKRKNALFQEQKPLKV